VLVAICTEALPDIRVAAPWLPPSLGSWFDKACARERGDRFQSADEMIEALQDAAGPASRLTRPSLPEEIGGPSGTLVGHVPPHAAATIMADAAELPLSGRAVSASSQRSDQAPRHGHDPLGERERHGGGRPRVPSDHLLLWAATGVGLACGTMALALVIGRTSPSASHAAPTAPPRPTSEGRATMTARLTTGVAPPPAPPTSTLGAAQRPPEPSAPLRSAPNAEPHAPAAIPAARESHPRATATARTRATVPVAASARTAEKPPGPRSTPVSTSTPDMGF
jgi:hypothetical protein